MSGPPSRSIDRYSLDHQKWHIWLLLPPDFLAPLIVFSAKCKSKFCPCASWKGRKWSKKTSWRRASQIWHSWWSWLYIDIFLPRHKLVNYFWGSSTMIIFWELLKIYDCLAWCLWLGSADKTRQDANLTNWSSNFNQFWMGGSHD